MACTASSSPPQGSLLSRTAMFRGHHLIPPSSPTAAYMDGEISPSFDASFASSMSISADVIVEPSPLAIPRRTQCRLSSSPNAMDISPAPIRAPIPIFRPPIVHAQSDFATAIPISTVPTVRPTLARARSTISAPRDYPFFSNLFGTTASAKDVPNKVLTSRSLSPETFLKPLPSIRQRSSAHLDWEESACTITRPEFISNVVGDTDSEGEESGLEGEMSPPTSIPKRSPLPTAWSASRHTAPAGELLPPPMPPLKRLSEPAIPTYKSLESSPMRMDVDPNSPGSASDFSAPRLNGQISSVRDLGDCFDGDLSPMPLSRKRFLPSELSPGTHSPTPLSSGSTFGMVLSAAPLIIPNRRVFEKASTVSSATSTAFIRRRPSSNNLNPKRPGPTSSAVFNMGPPPRSPVGEDTFKRQAQVFNGKPAAQKIRRAYSVAGPAGMLSTRDPNVPDSYRASTAADGFFQAFAKRSGNSNSIDIGMMDGNARRKQEDGSPLTGFRTQEEKGKSLPCFGVKEDGLMRISSETLSGLQRGDFSAGIKNYLIIDCRFSYEYDGGHISEAVNLPTTPEVEQALLALEDLPLPSTSEEGPAEGKTVLIFHCEFSAKRAPTSAKHLRSKDRLKNVGDYPRVHYPEVYILQGGYADFYKNYPDQCAGGYLPMDDPDHNAKRSVDLHAFRQQKRQFSRASSFTFGQAHSASSMLLADSARVPLSRQQLERTQSLAPSGFVFPIEKAQDTMSVHEEEHELADSSFGTSSGSSPGGQGSPCPPASKGGRPSLKIIGKELLFGGRRPLQRAQTSSVAMFGR